MVNALPLDVLLFRDDANPLEKAIEEFTKSPYYHAALWLGDGADLIIEAVFPVTHIVPVGRALKKGKAADVFTPIPPLTGAESVTGVHYAEMQQGLIYNIAAIPGFALGILGIARGRNPFASRLYRICSQLVQDTYAAMGRSVPGREGFVSPGGLAIDGKFKKTGVTLRLPT